jgi:preprotein translocase subunit SecG
MSILISILLIIASALLVILIFAQNPKGGGLSSDFGAATQLGGVQKTNDFVDKATWGLAGFIAVLSVVLTVYLTPKVQKVQEDPAKQGNGQTEMPAGQQGQPTDAE